MPSREGNPSHESSIADHRMVPAVTCQRWYSGEVSGDHLSLSVSVCLSLSLSVCLSLSLFSSVIDGQTDNRQTDNRQQTTLRNRRQ